MSFKFAVLKYAAKPVRGPRTTYIFTCDNEKEATAYAEARGEDSPDAFYVVEVVAKLARVMRVVKTRVEDDVEHALDRTRAWIGGDDGKTRARFDSGHPLGGHLCWGCSKTREEHTPDHEAKIGCGQWHGRDDP